MLPSAEFGGKQEGFQPKFRMICFCHIEEAKETVLNGTNGKDKTQIKSQNSLRKIYIKIHVKVNNQELQLKTVNMLINLPLKKWEL